MNYMTSFDRRFLCAGRPVSLHENSTDRHLTNLNKLRH